MSETHSDHAEMSATFSMQSKHLGKISCEFQNEEFLYYLSTSVKSSDPFYYPWIFPLSVLRYKGKGK